MKALDPANNVVINACAGSGKTWLLVSRIVRLLLEGAEFSEILAITFTRKAAQEMQDRLRQWLRMLAFGTDEEIEAFLVERGIEQSRARGMIPKARSLFEDSLAKQMTVTTFHGWFLEILKRAPLTANLAGAALADSSSRLVEEAWQRFAEGMQRDPGNHASIHLEQLFSEYGLSNTRKLLTNFLEKRAEWWAYTFGRKDPVGYALQTLREELDVDEHVIEKFRTDIELAGLMKEYAALLGRNAEKDKLLASELEEQISSGLPDFDRVWSVFHTKEGSLRSRSGNASQEKRLGSGGQERFLMLHHEIGMRLSEFRDAIVHLKIYRFNEAGLVAGCALLESYQDLKDEIGVIDFVDVEWRAYRLLNHSVHAQYMQYKLDARYRHILIDEFQDTNPFQWQTLKCWLDASSDMSIFMVGDPKQSIYRFRGAEARLFDIAADFLEREYGAVRISQNLSRRSAPSIIECVNRVFPDFDRHETARDMPGRVEVIPLVEDEREEAEVRQDLRNPLLEPRSEIPDERLEAEARAFASKLKEIVGRYPVRGEDGSIRAARHGDIMVLARKRANLPIYEKALKDLDIPYVGSSRGGLLDTLEATDIVALLAFLIAPFDDLHLAQVLKSPIFGCTEEDLAQLAGMKEGSWWRRMAGMDRQSALGSARFMLQGWMDRAGSLPVHDLLDLIYFEGDLLNRYRDAAPKAMKASVCANLLAFIELALEVDAGRYPSLPKFMAEIAAMRSSEEAPDEGLLGEVDDAVRFHTIHGAKGLEAPIVWLLGANAESEAMEEGYRVLVDWPPGETKPAHFSLHSLKEEKGALRMPYFEAEAMHAAREDANLLYVAITRAAQAFFVSGSPSRASRSWFARILDVMDAPGDYAPAAVEDIPKPFAQTEDYAYLKRAVRAGGREVSSPEMRHGIRLHEILQNGLKGNEEETLRAAAEQILGAPHLRRFFDPAHYMSAKNEVAYVSMDGEIRRMDRLVEFGDEVWIIDYKTGKNEAVYQTQMNEYRAAMQAVYDKPVRCGLVFSDGTLIEVPKKESGPARSG